jgi:hypothetical protein
MRTKKKRQTDEVEKALFARAVGYTVDEMTITPGEDGEKVAKIVRKPVAPSIQAQILWLRAYRPEIWGKSSTAAEADDSAAELFKALDRASCENVPFSGDGDDRIALENFADMDSENKTDGGFDNYMGNIADLDSENETDSENVTKFFGAEAENIDFS